jgi:hypothetical protein
MGVNNHHISYHKTAFFARAKHGFYQGKYKILHRYFTKSLQVIPYSATIPFSARGIITLCDKTALLLVFLEF